MLDNIHPVTHHERDNGFRCWKSSTGSYEIVHVSGRVEIRKACLCVAAFDGFLTDLGLAMSCACDWSRKQLAALGVTMDPATNRIANSDDDNRDLEARIEH
jgi:hypothetical protein